MTVYGAEAGRRRNVDASGSECRPDADPADGPQLPCSSALVKHMLRGGGDVYLKYSPAQLYSDVQSDIFRRHVLYGSFS
jgi:hypothetical protein